MNNAVDAIAESGLPGRIEVDISLQNGQPEANRDLVLRVSDSGAGASPADLARLFDPFFTTKPVGKGTGLGLYISNSIVKRHHGAIEAQSSPLGGMSIVVRLPAALPKHQG